MKMQFEEANSYATRANAVRKLEQHVRNEYTRTLIMVNSDGRFVPVVMMDSPEDMIFAHRGICVLK